MAKLTDTFVRNSKKPGVNWDSATTGLGLKVLGSGKKVWVMQLVWPGSKTQSTRNIGHYGEKLPALSLERARARAREFYAQAKEGADPFQIEEEEKQRAEVERQQEQEREAALRENTFGAVAERYIASRKNRRAKADAAEIRRMLVSEWGEKPIGDIKPDDVRVLIDKLKRRSSYGALAAWGHAVLIFKFAVHGWLDENDVIKKPITASPCASLDKKLLFQDSGIASRQRNLNDDEVAAFWRATSRLGYPAGPLYRLLLLTGCRLNEIAKARWSELHPELRRIIREADGAPIDWSAVPAEQKVLIIPRERFKSNAEHAVQLTDAACEVLAGVPRFGGCDYLFTATGDGPVWFGSKFKDRLDRRMLRTLRALARIRGDDPDQIALPSWVNHDLRRTLRTNLSALDVDDHIAEAALGHGRKGLQRTYDMHKFAPQIRRALERWTARIHEIAGPPPTAPKTPPADVVDLGARLRARA